jgi:hypothetical protein
LATRLEEAIVTTGGAVGATEDTAANTTPASSPLLSGDFSLFLLINLTKKKFSRNILIPEPSSKKHGAAGGLAAKSEGGWCL